MRRSRVLLAIGHLYIIATGGTTCLLRAPDTKLAGARFSLERFASLA